MLNMTIGDLKAIIKDLPDDMQVIMAVTDENNVNLIKGFKTVRTAGLLKSVNESKTAFCLNCAENGWDIFKQLKESVMDKFQAACERVMW